MVAHSEAYADAKASALRALAMDDGCADAQVALGSVLLLSEWDWTGAERSLRRALDINPAHPVGLLQYGSLMEALGHLEQGVRFKQQALERDSRSPLVFVQIAMSYWHQRHYDDAITWATRALDLDPRHLLAGEFLAGAYWKKGDIESFLAEQLRRAQVFGVPDATLVRLRRVCAEMKDAYAAGGPVKLTRYMLEQMPRTEGGAASVQCAVLHSAVGDLDTAFEHLDRALGARDPALVHPAVAPQWDSLRADVQDLLKARKDVSLPPARALDNTFADHSHDHSTYLRMSRASSGEIWESWPKSRSRCRTVNPWRSAHAAMRQSTLDRTVSPACRPRRNKSVASSNRARSRGDSTTGNAYIDSRASKNARSSRKPCNTS
jgi:hypothetical protein